MDSFIQWRGIASILLALAGCATTTMAAVEKDAAAKSFASTADQANVYVYRLSANAGGVTFPVSLDGRILGELAVGTFAHAVVTPGTHTVLVSGKGMEPVLVAVVAEAGKNVFVKVDPRSSPWGFVWPTPPTIHLLQVSDQEDAMEEVRRCDLIKGTDRAPTGGEAPDAWIPPHWTPQAKLAPQ